MAPVGGPPNGMAPAGVPPTGTAPAGAARTGMAPAGAAQPGTVAPASIEAVRIRGEASASSRIPRLVPMQYLETRRLRIRPYVPDDAVEVFEAIQESRSSLARWVPDIARRRTADEVRYGLESLARCSARGDRLVFGVWDRRDNGFLGE